MEGWSKLPASCDAWALEAAPFGRLVVWQAGASFSVIWRPSDSIVSHTVAGPFGTFEAAKDAAERWLFDSWSGIESQLEPRAEAALRAPAWWLWVGLALTALVAVGVFNGLQRAFG